MEKIKKKCGECKKKLTIIEREIICNCGFVFCGLHRHPENHNCSFNYKISEEKREMIIDNMKCDNQHIIRI